MDGPGSTARRGTITGMGAVSPLGVGVRALASGARGGLTGVRTLEPGWGERAGLSASVAARCWDWDPESVMRPGESAKLPRLVPMALGAAREALAWAGLGQPEGATELSRRVGLILGTGGGGIDFTGAQYRAQLAGQRPSLWTITNATHGNLAGELSIRLGLRGPSLCVSTGCASGSDAVGLALDQLRAGRAGSPDAWVVIGADAHIEPEPLRAMELLGVISTRDFRRDPGAAGTASRPFDARRDGFVLGEGAWAVVIERGGFAEERGARAVGEVLGYGATCDAYHRVRPAPDMEECARAMTLACEDAGVGPEEIEILHYHGTATELNDRLETEAVKRAFGRHAGRLVGHSIKGAIGHPQGASGMASLVSTLAGLTGADGGEPFGLPTANLVERDPACDLDYTPVESRATGARLALISCLAFGAKNSMLVVRAGDAVG